jgi:hypothetical protein
MPKHQRFHRYALCILSMLLMSSRAHAQSSGDSKAAAEALFDDARKLMTTGKYAQACAKLEASQALDPGVGTSLNLADCYEKMGRTASAWAQFRETMSAARRAGSSERERIARQRSEALEPKLSYLTIITWKGQDVTVSRDGQAVDAAVLSTPIPVDPGTHAIAASAPGKRAWTTDVTVRDNADRVSVSVPILADEPQPIEPSAQTEAPAPPPTAAELPSRPPSHAGATQRTIGIAAGAVGVAGIATGTVFGIKAASTWSDAKSKCNPYPYCGANGKKLSDEAADSGTIATVAFIAGGVALATGVVLWLTAPNDTSEREVAWGVGPGAIDVHGRF